MASGIGLLGRGSNIQNVLGLLGGRTGQLPQPGGGLRAPRPITPPTPDRKPSFLTNAVQAFQVQQAQQSEFQKTQAAIEDTKQRRETARLKRELDERKFQQEQKEFKAEQAQLASSRSARLGILQGAQARGDVPPGVDIGLLAEDPDAFEDFSSNILFPKAPAPKGLAVEDPANPSGSPIFVSVQRAIDESLTPVKKEPLVNIVQEAEKLTEELKIKRGFKLEDDIDTRAQLAQESNTNVQQLRGAFADVDQTFVEGGAFGNLRLRLAKIANLFGADLEGVGPAEQGEALAKQMALQLRNPKAGAGMPGQLSNADRDFLSQMVPGIETTAEGRQLILDAWEARNDRAVLVADMAQDYLASTGKPFLDREFKTQMRKFHQDNPIFADLVPPGGATPGINPSVEGLSQNQLFEGLSP